MVYMYINIYCFYIYTYKAYIVLIYIYIIERIVPETKIICDDYCLY